MRVAIVGGAGAIGRRAAALLADQSSVESMVIADIEPVNAAEVASRFGSKATAYWTDFADPREAREALEGADLALGCLGGRPALERPIVEAAIDARIPYVGICDDWKVTEEILEMDPDASEAHTLVVTGAGASPGLTNLMAIHASRDLDEVDEIHVSWVGSTNSPSGAEAVTHTLKSFGGTARTYSGGGWRFVRAGGAREQAWFPEPVGAVDVATCRHPEPVMLARHFPEAREISVKGSLGIAFLQDAMRLASRLGVSRSTLERAGGLPGIETWLPGVGVLGGGHRWSALRVEVRGKRRQKPATVILGAVDSMQNLAAGPLAATALAIGQVASGEGVVGVRTPEEVVEPVEIFQRLASWGIKVARLEPAEGVAA